MKTIASLYEVRPDSGAYRARLLHPHRSTPVEYFFQGDQDIVVAHLVMYDAVPSVSEVVPNDEFEREIEEMRLFGHRVNEPSVETERLTDTEIETILNHGERILDGAIRQIESMEADLNAAITSSRVAAGPETSI